MYFFFFFFFSSRRRHTRLQGDWSSDVCSSDLERIHVVENSTGDDSVEGSYVVELLESDPAIERPFRRMRIDPEDVVTRVCEIRNDPTLVSAPDLQHAQRWKRELRKHEVSERQRGEWGWGRVSCAAESRTDD